MGITIKCHGGIYFSPQKYHVHKEIGNVENEKADGKVKLP